MSELKEIDREKLADLLAKVQAATGPDVEIDAALYVLEVPRMAEILPHWSAIQKSDLITPYTDSIDASLALVERLLPDWQMEQVAWGKDKGGPIIASIGNFGRADEYRCGYGDASTVPLAILAALLSALSSIKEVGK
jgi:hypothetical protein